MSEDPHGHCGGYYQAGHACGEVDDLIDRAESAEATLDQVRRLVEQWAEREATDGEHVYYRELRNVLAGGGTDA